MWKRAAASDYLKDCLAGKIADWIIKRRGIGRESSYHSDGTH